MSDAFSFDQEMADLAGLSDTGSPKISPEIEKKIKGIQSFATKAAQEAKEAKQKISEYSQYEKLHAELKARGLDPDSAIKSLQAMSQMQYDLENDPDTFRRKTDQMYLSQVNGRKGNGRGNGDPNRGWGGGNGEGQVVDEEARKIGAYAAQRAAASELNFNLTSLHGEYQGQGLNMPVNEFKTKVLEVMGELGLKDADSNTLSRIAKAAFADDVASIRERAAAEAVSKKLKQGMRAQPFGETGGGAGGGTGDLGIDEAPPTKLTEQQRIDRAARRINEMRSQRNAV